MLNTDPILLVPDSPRRSILSWTAPAADLDSWIFVNGLRIYGPLPFDTADREVTIAHPAGVCLAIEVHDVPEGDPATPISAPAATRPTIQWNPVPAAARYRLYHREGADGEELQIFDRPAHQFTGVPIRIDAPIAFNGIGGVWHFLRVESVDEYGNESTRASWRYFSAAPPAPPAAVTIQDGSAPGLFSITITP